MFQLKLLGALLMVTCVYGVCGQYSQQQNHRRSRHYDSNDDDPASYGVSRQYAHFAGPVSGAETQIVVPKSNNPHHPAGNSFDYVAKPDYKFGYGVEDSKTGNKQTHSESRDGDVVRGEYSILEPDGSMRIVQYTADPRNGFQAVVKRQGFADEVFGAPSASKNKPKVQPKPKHQQQQQQYNNYDDEDYDD